MAGKAKQHRPERGSTPPDNGAGDTGADSAHTSEYAALLEILPDAIVVHLNDGQIVYANTAGFHMFGAVAADDLIGQPSARLVPQETADAIHKISNAVMKNGKVQEFEGLFLAMLDETRIEVSGQCAPFTWEGTPALITIYRDLSKQRQAEESFQERFQDLELTKVLLEKSSSEYAGLAEELRAAKDVAELANRSKSDFLANMSHELRTPLNAIMGFSEVIKDEMLGEIGTPQYVEYAHDIFSSGEHLLEIINEILDLSKIEAGRFDLTVAEIDLRDVMSTVQNLVKGRSDDKNITLNFDISPDLPRLLADERAIRQMLLNLLSNALKFTPESGDVDITAGTGSDGGIRIEVRDNGIGIDDTDIASVMLPFGQVDSPLAREHQGTGLGLPLVKAMLDLHNGTLDLQSTAGSGTTVSLCFPPDRSIPAGRAVPKRNVS